MNTTDHKDKFVSPIIYSELETLEVKRNGKVEHSANGHDDQIFSYLMALYVWYEGKNLKENYGIVKQTLRTDDDELDEIINPIEAKYEGILDEVEADQNDMVSEQLKALQTPAILQQQWREQQYKADRDALEKLLANNPLAVKAYEEKYSTNLSDKMNTGGLYQIPDEMFDIDFGYAQQFDNLSNYYTEPW